MACRQLDNAGADVAGTPQTVPFIKHSRASTLKPAGDLTLPEGHQPPEPAPGGGGLSLRADCERCFALCCVAPAFSASADFAISKPAGQPCPNLQPDFRCSIHDRLRPRGFGGCTAYDCFGAGQQVAQVTFGGRDWRQAPEIAAQMFDVFGIVRQLHELLWYLTEALTLPPARCMVSSAPRCSRPSASLAAVPMRWQRWT
jgi:hypothetical protein